ncbi:MAG: ATP-binding protein [Colwellia sp.]|nr:ATP-binding protein [Colwellia sp.]
MDKTIDNRHLVGSIFNNAAEIQAEINWFIQFVDERMRVYFSSESHGTKTNDTPVKPPNFTSGKSSYALMINRLGLSDEERLILILALVPFIKPELFDIFLTKNDLIDCGYTEFGGLQAQGHNGFLPTVETAFFILSGQELEKRFELMALFENDGILFTSGLMALHQQNINEPWTTSLLQVNRETLNQLTIGNDFQPDFNSNFPAKLITTLLTWEDLILPMHVKNQLDEVVAWSKYGKVLLDEWGMFGKISSGFTGLFYGPSGTGKTLAATLLAEHCDKTCYKIDLSMIVSKYIGETEKNLSRIFDSAENRNWMLFFDEADALFGKRTTVSDAHDRYANQEVSYLLQRIETYSGIVILASNFKSNIDEAFLRRFQAVIEFSIPSVKERYDIWRKAISSKAILAEDIDLMEIAEKYEITGGTIVNIVRFASLKALSNERNTLFLDDIVEGIRREFSKLGRHL